MPHWSWEAFAAQFAPEVLVGAAVLSAASWLLSVAYRKLLKKPLKKWRIELFQAVAGFAIVALSFWAIRYSIADRSTTPDFRGSSIENLALMERSRASDSEPRSRTIIAIIAIFRNVGVTSSVEAFKMSLKTSDGINHEGMLGIEALRASTVDPARTLVFPPLRTPSRPIPTGEAVPVSIYSHFDVEYATARLPTSVVSLEFRDTFGKSYSINYTVGSNASNIWQ
jgi:hypothetical protein